MEANEEIRSSLVNVQKELEQTGADLKIVKPENIHLTLKFLGDISENQVDLVKEALQNATEAVDPFQVQVKGLGVFPEPSFIRVIWAGVTEGEEQLKSIRKDLDQSLSKISQSSDNKEYIPHYTIARVKSGKAKDKLNSIIENKSDVEWGSIEADKVELKKSELTSEGPIYSTLEAVSLS